MPRKLIRDFIPQFIRKSTKKPFKLGRDYEIAEPKDVVHFLAKKLVEEADEYLKAIRDFGFTKKGASPDVLDYMRLDELADVYETVKALAELDGLSMADVETAVVEKRKSQGGFKKNFLLVLPWKDHDRSPRDGSLFHDLCSVSFNGDIDMTTDGRERGLWFWIRNTDLEDVNREAATLLEWPAIRKLHKAIGNHLKRK